MRYAFIPLTFLLVASAQAQDAKQQRITQAIDAAERICLVGNRFKFSADVSGNVTITKLIPGAAGKVDIDRTQATGSQFFEREDVRRLVDDDIRTCMKSEWPNVLRALESALPTQFKRIACTGQYEGSCPGRHDIFYTCDYIPGSDAQIAAQMCQGSPSKALRINTVGGNKCGYALIEITCN